MSTSATNRIAIEACAVLVATLISTAAVAGFAGPATVTALTDHQFGALLTPKGITFPNPAVAVQEANVVCAQLDGGQTYVSLVDELSATDPIPSPYLAGSFIKAAVANYCPQHLDALPQ